jgi:uncharacterized protein (TIGR02145 family)
MSGDKLVTVRPAEFTAGEIDANPFIEKSSTLRFDAFIEGTFATAELELRHVNYNTVVDVDAVYGIGNVSSFTVRSNARWEVSDVYSDDDGILDLSYIPSLLDRSGGHNTTGEKVYFKLVDDVNVDGKTAVLTLVDPDHLVGNVTVTIKAIACGTGGTAVPKRIGNRDYLTHVYGDKCWMVENSREGTAAAHYYQNNGQYALGYYYNTAGQKWSACPSGWHLPTNAEFDVVKSEVGTTTEGKDKWWNDKNLLAGYLGWGGWHTEGRWQATDGKHASGSNEYNSYRSYGSGISGPNTSVIDCATVRCVQD